MGKCSEGVLSSVMYRFLWVGCDIYRRRKKNYVRFEFPLITMTKYKNAVQYLGLDAMKLVNCEKKTRHAWLSDTVH